MRKNQNIGATVSKIRFTTLDFLNYTFFISNPIENCCVSVTAVPLELKFGMGMFFDARKPMVLSEFQNLKLLTPFVTSLTPDYSQNGSKFT